MLNKSNKKIKLFCKKLFNNYRSTQFFIIICFKCFIFIFFKLFVLQLRIMLHPNYDNNHFKNYDEYLQ